MNDVVAQLYSPPFSDTVLCKLHALLTDENAGLEAIATASSVIRALPAFVHLTQGQLLAENVAVRGALWPLLPAQITQLAT